jgi:hypothetical protein
MQLNTIYLNLVLKDGRRRILGLLFTSLIVLALRDGVYLCSLARLHKNFNTPQTSSQQCCGSVGLLGLPRVVIVLSSHGQCFQSSGVLASVAVEL